MLAENWDPGVSRARAADKAVSAGGRPKIARLVWRLQKDTTSSARPARPATQGLRPSGGASQRE